MWRRLKKGWGGWGGRFEGDWLNRKLRTGVLTGRYAAVVVIQFEGAKVDFPTKAALGVLSKICHSSGPSDGIQRARSPTRSNLEHMRVNHGCTHIAVTQKLLYRAYVCARLKQMGCKRMPQRMS